MNWDSLDASVPIGWEIKRLSLINRLGNMRSAGKARHSFCVL